MTFEELKEILTNIKAHYQNFAIYDYVVKEWYKVLKDYEYDDVMESLVDHLTPKDLKKESESNRYIVSCNLCDRWMSLDEFDKHYDKCLHEFGRKFKNTKRI